MPSTSRKAGRAAGISIAVDEEANKAVVRVSPTKKRATTGGKRKHRVDRDGEVASQAQTIASIYGQASLDTFDADIQARRSDMESRMHAILDGVRGECKTLLSRIPTSLANMTVAEFADTYAFSYDLATRGQAHSKRMQIDETRALASPSKLERGVASAMKRKRGDALPTPTLSQAEPGSPMPSRPAKRPAHVPSVASTSTAKASTGQLKRSTRSRAASPTSAAAQPSMHQGFVYRARPSLLEQGAVDTAMPVPPTPSGRRPRKHESIQAFSLNGSPLGLLDVERDGEDGTMAEVERAISPDAPTGDFTFAVPLPANFLIELRRQLREIVMAPEDRAKIKALLDEQLRY